MEIFLRNSKILAFDETRDRKRYVVRVIAPLVLRPMALYTRLSDVIYSMYPCAELKIGSIAAP